MRCLCATLNQLEFLAELQALRAFQVDFQVGVGGITIGARAPLDGKMHAVFTSETQLEARGFLAKPQVDGRAHGFTEKVARVARVGRRSENCQ